jgi:hypothetical protein
MKDNTKVHRNFKIFRKLDTAIRRHSRKTSIKQMRIVEMALTQFFAVKR